MIAEAANTDTKIRDEKLFTLSICTSAFAWWVIYLYLSWEQGTDPNLGLPLMIVAAIAAFFPFSRRMLVGMVIVTWITVSALYLAHGYVFANFDTMPRWMFSKQLGQNTERTFDIKTMTCLTGCKPEFGEISNNEYERLRDVCKPRGVMQTRYSADEKLVYIRCGKGFKAFTAFAERGAFELAEAKFEQAKVERHRLIEQKAIEELKASKARFEAWG